MMTRMKTSPTEDTANDMLETRVHRNAALLASLILLELLAQALVLREDVK